MRAVDGAFADTDGPSRRAGLRSCRRGEQILG